MIPRVVAKLIGQFPEAVPLIEHALAEQQRQRYLARSIDSRRELERLMGEACADLNAALRGEPNAWARFRDLVDELDEAEADR